MPRSLGGHKVKTHFLKETLLALALMQTTTTFAQKLDTVQIDKAAFIGQYKLVTKDPRQNCRIESLDVKESTQGCLGFNAEPSYNSFQFCSLNQGTKVYYSEDSMPMVGPIVIEFVRQELSENKNTLVARTLESGLSHDGSQTYYEHYSEIKVLAANQKLTLQETSRLQDSKTFTYTCEYAKAQQPQQCNAHTLIRARVKKVTAVYPSVCEAMIEEFSGSQSRSVFSESDDCVYKLSKGELLSTPVRFDLSNDGECSVKEGQTIDGVVIKVKHGNYFAP